MSVFLLNVGFFASFLALAAWYYSQNRAPWGDWFRNTLLASLGIYLVGWFSADAAFALKIPALFRDLLMLGAAGVVFRILLKRPVLFFLSTGVIFTGLVLFLNIKTTCR